jgi:FdhD protein
MFENQDFGPSTPMSFLKVTKEAVAEVEEAVATEIPFTLQASDTEIATLQCSPSHLEELVYGFLYTAGFIGAPSDVKSCRVERTRWTAFLEMDEIPDPLVLSKRIYTSGCGKGVTYAHVNEAAARLPMNSQLTITRDQVNELAGWLQHTSELYRSTRGIHTAGLSVAGRTPAIGIDDIGRHNAVDKVIGSGLLTGVDFSQSILISSGRISSEILHKIKRCGIPIIIARGGPTHQTVLRARDMGVTVVGFARGGAFSIFAHPERLILKP